MTSIMGHIKTAMVLAAGRGVRMRSGRNDPPKPLTPIKIGDSEQVLMDFILHQIIAVGINRIIINVHHKAEQIMTHIENHALIKEKNIEIIFSDERDYLRETGGGVAHALCHLDSTPFLVCNADVIWQAPTPSLPDFIAAYDPHKMRGLLLLAEMQAAIGIHREWGDFIMDDKSCLRRLSPKNKTQKNYIFTGVQILDPSLFSDIEDDIFSLNLIYDKAIAASHLYGHILAGQFLHIGTPEARTQAAEILSGQ